jgi:hypothetical protein
MVHTVRCWTRQNPDQNNRRMDKWNETKHSWRTNGRNGDLINAIWRGELTIYIKINKYFQNLKSR